MSATNQEIRVAMAAAIKTGLGRGWQVSAYMLALPKPPTVDIRPGGVTYHQAMVDGLDDLTFTVRGVAAWNNDRGPQIKLDLLQRGPQSIRAILETDLTLGGIVDDLTVRSASEYRTLIVEGQPPLLAVDFTVEVYPKADV